MSQNIGPLILQQTIIPFNYTEFVKLRNPNTNIRVTSPVKKNVTSQRLKSPSKRISYTSSRKITK